MAKNYENDELVVLKNDGGEEIKLIEIAGIALESGYYAILQPVELLEGMEEDEALVFEVETTDEGDDKYTIVLDDDVVDAVFEEYYRLLDEAEEQE